MATTPDLRIDRLEDRFETHCRESAALHSEVKAGLAEIGADVRAGGKRLDWVMGIAAAILAIVLGSFFLNASRQPVSHSTATPQVQR